MPSLSKTVFLNGWMTLSPWVIYLGLVAICSPAAAELELSAEPVVDQPAVSRSVGPSIHPTKLKLTQASSNTLINSNSSSNFQLHPDGGETESAGELQAIPDAVSRTNLAPVNLAQVASEMPGVMPGETPGETPGNSAAENTVDITVSANECLAACNPTERFLFNSPNIAIPPRSVYPRPMMAQSPAPAPGTVSQPLAQNAPGWSNQSSPSYISRPSSPSHIPSQPSPSYIPGQPPPDVIQPSPADPTQVTTASTPRRALTPPSLQFQGVYIYQGGESSARFRVTGVYPILPELQVGSSIDFTEGNVFSESDEDGLSINELYVAASVPNYPNLRLIVGQIDLTSYFDRNSFAKDSATHFFNPVFATNPALAAAGLGARQGAVVNWTITDNIEAKAAVFSSDRSISDFALNGFAGELGGRLGNLIVRGTYVTGIDSGANTGFEEIYGQQRSNGDFGLSDGDREDGYGINAEYFIPEIRLGLFARYGWYENRGADQGGTTYSVGANLLDLFMQDDRLGIAYGRQLSNDDLNEGDNPDVLEAFYDFRVLDFLRLGATFQVLDGFSETIAGFRIRTDFDLIPRRGQ